MFNNPFSMVVAIVAIVSIASIIRARYGLHRHGRRHEGGVSGEDINAMREDIRGLKARVAVLERLATDDRAALEREFEQLRQNR